MFHLMTLVSSFISVAFCSNKRSIFDLNKMTLLFDLNKMTQLLRPEVKSRIHSSHLGVEACLRKARDTVFWPGMNAEVRDQIKQCSICNEFQAKNQKLPMQSHKLPDRPWSTNSSFIAKII